MTVTVAVNAVDSIVLASDSATTQQAQILPGQTTTINIWNSANKIFNLRKSWPVGAMTWGRATIGNRSIATLAKELRCRFSGQRAGYEDWELDAATYTITEVAERTKAFFYDEQWASNPAQDVLGLAIAGYSSGSDEADDYGSGFHRLQRTTPKKLRQTDITITRGSAERF